MQHHIIRLISVNLSKILGPEYFTTLFKFDDVECFDGIPKQDKWTEYVFQAYSGGYVSFILQEMMLSARLRAWIILQLIVNLIEIWIWCSGSWCQMSKLWKDVCDTKLYRFCKMSGWWNPLNCERTEVYVDII